MEVLYRNKSYKSKRKSPKDPKTGMKTRIPRTPDMEGDGIGISEQQLDPNILAVTSEEDESGLIGNCARPGTSASETDEGCTLDEGRIGQGATEEEYHTSTLNGIVLEVSGCPRSTRPWTWIPAITGTCLLVPGADGPGRKLQNVLE